MSLSSWSARWPIAARRNLLKLVRSISDLINISYVRQKEPLGLGHAVLCARNLVGDEPFAVFLGDDIITARTPVMKQMIRIFGRRRHSLLAVERIERERSRDYGVIAHDGRGRDSVYRVTDLVEKPAPEDAPSDLAIIGRYILTPQIFSHLAKTPPDAKGEIQLTNGLRSLLRKQPISAYRFEGRRFDTGNKLGFLKATVEFALKRKDLGGDFRAYLKSLKI